MAEAVVEDYPVYVRGCEKLGWTPLTENEFRYLYAIFQDCETPLLNPASEILWKPLRYLTAPFRLRKIRRALRTRKQLQFIVTAMVTGGEPDDGDATAGTPAVLPTPPRSRGGRHAEPIPVVHA